MNAISRSHRRALEILIPIAVLCLIGYGNRFWRSPQGELLPIRLEARHAEDAPRSSAEASVPAHSYRQLAAPARAVGADALGVARTKATGTPLPTEIRVGAGLPDEMIRAALALNDVPAADSDYAWLIAATRSETTDLERRLFEDADDGRWDTLSLPEAAAVAAGVRDAAELQWLRRRMEFHVRNASRRIDAGASARQRLETVFRYLHEEILTGDYRLEATSPLEPLTRGRYNCVSATVWFCALAERLGLSAEPLQSPTHAYCRVDCQGRPVIVEATCAEWFDLRRGDHGESRDSRLVGGTEGGENGPLISGPKFAGKPDPYGDATRSLSPVALVGTVYYNRGVEAVLKKRFAEAVADNVKALFLDPGNRTARDNLLAALNNWAIAAAGAKDYPAAAQRLRLAVRIDPDYGPLPGNVAQLYARWALHLAEMQDTAQAATVIREALDLLPSDPNFAEQRRFLQSLSIR
ncbi:MAG: hypothetical protein Kow0040_21880 [Thermogutta sp.]